MKSEITFHDHQMVEMAQFISELIRQGIVFKTENNNGSFTIYFTGGF